MIMKNAMKDKGYSGVIFDSEFANNDMNSMEARGLDTSQILWSGLEHIEDLKTQTLNTLEEIDPKEKVVMLIDSIGNLPSRKELEDGYSGSDKKDMTRPSALKSYFRSVTMPTGFKNVSLLAINHVYASTGCVTDSSYVQLSDGTTKCIKDIVVGDVVRTLIGDKPIIDTYKYDDKDTFTLTLGNGSEITATPNHKFLTETLEWKSVDNLNEGDSIIIDFTIDDVQ